VDLDKPVSELIKPSIFDDENVKATKEQLAEMSHYLDEIDFMEKNKTELDQIKKDKEEAQANADAPVGFGKP
jgi:hypothetical protein